MADKAGGLATRAVAALGTIAALLTAQPASSATHHHSGGTAGRAHKHPGPSKEQAALNAARAAEAALRAQQAAQAAALEASRRASAQAQAKAVHDAARANTLSAETVSAAAQLQRTEEQGADLQQQIEALHDQQQKLREALDNDARAMTPIVPVVARLSRYPAETLLAAPMGKDQAIAGLLVMRGLSATLERRAEEMRQHKAELVVLDGDLAARSNRLMALDAQQEKERDALARQSVVARDKQIRSNAAASTAAAAVARAAAKASTLQDAVARIMASEAAAQRQLEQEAQAAERAHKTEQAAAARSRARALANDAGPGLSPTAPSAAEAPSAGAGSGSEGSAGALVAGTVLTGWHGHTEAGPATGITYAAQPGAVVRSPCSGRIDFSGPFRSYGQMVILDCGHRFRFVLAGLGALDTAPGQSLAKGSALGHMPQTGGHPSLFVQLREGETVVNPAPFL